MTPVALAVVGAGVVAGAAAAAVLSRTLGVPHRTALRLAAIAVLAGAVLAVAGLLTGVAPIGYLVDLAAAAAPVIVVVHGMPLRHPPLVALVWAVVVLPLALILPLEATLGCAGSACAPQDFGGALPLVVSAATLVLALELFRRPSPAPVSGRLRLRTAFVVWAATIVLLASMEGALDAYTVRLLLAGLIGPAAAALGWLIVDRLRRARRRALASSLACGIVAGAIATLPGAATVVAPWSVGAGLVAGAVGALVLAPARRSPARLAAGALAIVGVGLLAPVVAGDAVGFLFTAAFVAFPVVAGLVFIVGAVGVAVGLVLRLVLRR